MFFPLPWFSIPIAAVLDLTVGDPQKLPHPIRLMGWLISRLEPAFRRMPLPLGQAGGVFALSLILSVLAITWLLIHAAALIHPFFANTLEILFIYYAVSIKSLADAARGIFVLLTHNRTLEARRQLSFIVGRETNQLGTPGISAGAVETVAENFVDGVVSPLLYALIGGAPLAMAYKMINTLDSMIGYKNETYREFGKCAARVDDAANWLPARISVLPIAAASQMLAGGGRAALQTAFADGRKHASPNAGFPEAAFAGALKIRLGGPNRYHGRMVDKPFIGEAFPLPAPRDIRRACDLMHLSALLWAAAVSGMALI